VSHDRKSREGAGIPFGCSSPAKGPAKTWQRVAATVSNLHEREPCARGINVKIKTELFINKRSCDAGDDVGTGPQRHIQCLAPSSTTSLPAAMSPGSKNNNSGSGGATASGDAAGDLEHREHLQGAL
jgi:hypothetical protein